MEGLKVKSKKRTIYILLTNTGSVPTKIIQVYTKAPYNHVAISFTKDLRQFYSFGRKKYNNPLWGGFVIEGIDSKIYEYFSETTCSIFSLEVELGVYSRMRKVIKRFEKERDKYVYSFIGLLGVIVKVPIEREYGYFCSQFVATVLEKSGLNLFNKRPGLVTPNDFMNLKELNHIYTGKLSDYSKEANLSNYKNFIPVTNEV
ncbi:hypothetical protein [Proteiniborus sp. MB09-C3]|uniref:hypothetical protein n=1 Tax=Proteiniborus sp. MB09-C3 TaxID=3050072 RepID=UPI002553AED6|nr:hypothetical protein [Proteiniborus sp. MB09-C3]WIV12022.1 hypothetical protein QO263_18295 [Proteiniborus sp. MB09-C3]